MIDANVGKLNIEANLDFAIVMDNKKIVYFVKNNKVKSAMKYFVLVFFILSCINFAYGQKSFKRNDIYVEAGGNSFWASINYERRLEKVPGFGLRVGLGFYTEERFYLTLPISVNYLIKLKNNTEFIDLGFGATFARVNETKFEEDENHFIGFVPSIGYRRHFGDKFMCRLSFTPVFNKSTFVPWLGISFGKRF